MGYRRESNLEKGNIMPKERVSLFRLLAGDEPGPIKRILHEATGGSEGDWGEECIATLLANRCPGMPIFRNVYIPTEDGHTTELDVVMACSGGVYVFESKAYGGKIYGQAGNMYWYQYLSGVKHSFYNPVIQNKNHCQHLAHALQMPAEKLFSFVVFENRADLSHISSLDEDHFCICNREELPRLLKVVNRERGPQLDREEITHISWILSELTNVTTDEKEAHVHQIRERFGSNTCPLCGKDLVERTGRHGSFIGCTGYPRCRYTRPIT